MLHLGTKGCNIYIMTTYCYSFCLEHFRNKLLFVSYGDNHTIYHVIYLLGTKIISAIETSELELRNTYCQQTHDRSIPQWQLGEQNYVFDLAVAIVSHVFGGNNYSRSPSCHWQKICHVGGNMYFLQLFKSVMVPNWRISNGILFHSPDQIDLRLRLRIVKNGKWNYHCFYRKFFL